MEKDRRKEINLSSYLGHRYLGQKKAARKELNTIIDMLKDSDPPFSKRRLETLAARAFKDYSELKGDNGRYINATQANAFSRLTIYELLEAYNLRK